jgi:hypothetical protein
VGREVRRVSPNWQHPKREDGRYVSLSDGYFKAVAEWDEEAAQWERGLRLDYSKDGRQFTPREDSPSETYEEYAGARPDHREYMPDWPAQERTHWQMYEDTSEGTPISPVFATPEELARWLAVTGASAFADVTATHEEWLATIRRGSAISMIISAKGIQSGVAANVPLS